MNLSDILIYLIFLGVGGISGIIVSILSGVFSHFVINQIFSESFSRMILNLVLVFISSYLGSMIGLLGIIGFAADENAGEIFPYYLGISLLVSILCTVSYYFIRIR